MIQFINFIFKKKKFMTVYNGLSKMPVYSLDVSREIYQLVFRLLYICDWKSQGGEQLVLYFTVIIVI